MSKVADLRGHTSRVLMLLKSPDGTTVASAAGDETIRLVLHPKRLESPVSPKGIIAGTNQLSLALPIFFHFFDMNARQEPCQCRYNVFLKGQFISNEMNGKAVIGHTS